MCLKHIHLSLEVQPGIQKTLNQVCKVLFHCGPGNQNVFNVHVANEQSLGTQCQLFTGKWWGWMPQTLGHVWSSMSFEEPTVWLPQWVIYWQALLLYLYSALIKFLGWPENLQPFRGTWLTTKWLLPCLLMSGSLITHTIVSPTWENTLHIIFYSGHNLGL